MKTTSIILNNNQTLKVQEIIFPVSRTLSTKSLCWYNDALIDWVGGGTIYHLNGVNNTMYWMTGYGRFDTSQVSSSGSYVIIYESLGTKGIILDLRNINTKEVINNRYNKNEKVISRPKFVREFNRSYLQADQKEYAVASFSLCGKSEVIVHCPELYNKISVECIESAEHLCGATVDDIFFSRFIVNHSGEKMIGFGWDTANSPTLELFEYIQGKNQYHIVNTGSISGDGSYEIVSAYFVDDNTILIIQINGDILRGCNVINDKYLIQLYDLNTNKTFQHLYVTELHSADLIFMNRWAFDIVNHPKIVDFITGEIIYSWNSIATGVLDIFDLWKPLSLNKIAIDTKHKRIAFISDDNVYVFTLSIN